ncbi:NACHT domain-containing protein [Sphingobacterium sp. HJSM2_6]|uniref:NACHT domain-containing protein n=1 Tax=Sphingobacterium sp. HJSM2_6 TaxID=3366264 RepID=UPI003BBD962C
MERNIKPHNRKIDIIKNLAKGKLFDLLITIVGKLGYISINHDSDVIVGTYSGPLSKHKHAFIYLDQKLNSSENTEEYVNKIKLYSDQNKVVTFFVFSNNVISKGFQNDLSTALKTLTIDYIGRDDLIELIDKFFTDFWKHDDVELLNYEKIFSNNLIGDNELKKLQIFNEKYDKLLQIFIEPDYFHFYEDKNTNTPVRKKVSIERLCLNDKTVILSGSAGTGKTTTLKKIGEYLIDLNKTQTNKKNIPIFLSVTELFDEEYNIDALVKNKLALAFSDIQLCFENYQITILIDTIDELEQKNQDKILKQLEKLSSKNDVNIIIATRNHEKLYSNPILKNADNFSIEKFNNDQIKRFVSNFFQHETSRADALLDALRDNRILEKLPITPLTLSLISILYEENNLEIPATITDIYDNFNAVLLGKAIVSSRLEFIDSSFRERILSLYGLALLERIEHTPMEKEEFFEYFQNYYADKTIPIRKGSIKDVLTYLIDNTGILLLKDGKYIQFSHDSFMEYYGAIEIFKHQRNKEELIIENFFDINWQNSSFFYAGKSRDMSEFLLKVISKVQSASKVNDFFMGVMGLGYLMQSLYQTDNKIRKIGVDTAINVNIQAYEALMKISGDEDAIFKNYKLPIMLLMNVFYFFENFNSVTLKEPLTLSFIDLFQNYLKEDETNIGYKALKIALTLNSKRINEGQYLEKLIFKSNLCHDPNLVMLTDLALELNRTDNYKDLKKAIKKDFNKLSAPLKKLSEIPASRLRFTSYDAIKSERKFQILTEGKTDARIIEHAYMVLTKGDLPYWEIKPAGSEENSGAKELTKTLQSAAPLLNSDQKLIGIYDRDNAGLEEFRRLKNFEDIENHTVRKCRSDEIYAICLPIIENRENYLQEKQVFNFFEIEHYFPNELLEKHNKLKTTAIDGVHEIIGNKNSFASEIVKIHDPEIFRPFMELFRRIDNITNMNIDYHFN